MLPCFVSITKTIQPSCNTQFILTGNSKICAVEDKKYTQKKKSCLIWLYHISDLKYLQTLKQIKLSDRNYFCYLNFDF